MSKSFCLTANRLSSACASRGHKIFRLYVPRKRPDFLQAFSHRPSFRRDTEDPSSFSYATTSTDRGRLCREMSRSTHAENKTPAPAPGSRIRMFFSSNVNNEAINCDMDAGSELPISERSERTATPFRSRRIASSLLRRRWFISPIRSSVLLALCVRLRAASPGQTVFLRSWAGDSAARRAAPRAPTNSGWGRPGSVRPIRPTGPRRRRCEGDTAVPPPDRPTRPDGQRRHARGDRPVNGRHDIGQSLSASHQTHHSLSQRTVHVVEIEIALYLPGPAPELLDGHVERPRHHLQNRPVPAAHLSFMAKSLTRRRPPAG